jgi:uncharacterized protein YlxW (UPF0749 family)
MIFNLKYSTQSNHFFILTSYIIFIFVTLLSTTAAFGSTNDLQDTKEEQIKTSGEIRILKNNTEAQVANLQQQITTLEENLLVYNTRLVELESVQYINQIIAIIAIILVVFFKSAYSDGQPCRTANAQEDEEATRHSADKP